MIDYDTLPFKVFHMVIHDYDKYSHLLGIEDEQERRKQWDRVIDSWKERHPSADERDLAQEMKSSLIKTVKLGKLVSCLKFMLLFTDVDEEKQKEIFKEAKAPWRDDPLKRLEVMKKQLEKAKTEKEIHDARLQKLAQEIKEKREARKAEDSALTPADINKSIASLEIAGFNIENYETLTCGKYDAMSAVIREQNQRYTNKHGK